MVLLARRMVVVLLLFAFSASCFAQLPDIPLSQTQGLQRVSSMPMFRLPAINMSSSRAAALPRGKPGPLQFAQPFAYSIKMAQTSGWQKLAYQGQKVDVLRYQIESPNALSLNLGFSRYNMPKGGQLFIYADDYAEVIGPFTHRDNDLHGQLWTPIINGKKITIEINIPASLKHQLDIELSKINQGFIDIGHLSTARSTLKSGPCNVDVACAVADGWEDQIRSVARYTRNGIFFCTGAAINNTANDKKAYFLTANHCGFNVDNAATIVAYWNYQNSFCRSIGTNQNGLAGNGRLVQFNSGAVLRASYAETDVALLEFDDPILLNADVYLAGWNRSTVAPEFGVGIHHPGGQEKRISFDYNPISIQSSPITISEFVYDAGNLLRVNNWELGTTEGGSSGSPLFDQHKRIVGQLTGGLAFCGNNAPDWYGRFAASWSGGGTDLSRLSNWLDPINSGKSKLDGQESLRVDQFEVDNSSAQAKTIVSGVPQMHSLHTVADQDWVTFTIDEAADVELTMQASLTDVGVITLYNDDLIQLDSVSGSTAQISIVNLSAGKYFVRAQEFENNNYIGSYTLTYNAFRVDQYESDNDASSAKLVELGQTQTRSLYPQPDEDWVRFSLTRETSMDIYTQGVLGNTQLWLYDALFNQVAYDNNSGIGLFSRISMDLLPGTYYVRVNEVNAQPIASYKLVVSEEEDILLMIIPAVVAGSRN